MMLNRRIDQVELLFCSYNALIKLNCHNDQVELIFNNNSKKKKKNVKNGINFSNFDLTYEDGKHVANIPAVPLGNKPLTFSLPMYIKAECASNWTPQYLDMLGIEFVNAKTLEKLLAVYIPTVKIKTSDLAMKLISELAGLTPMLVNEFVINHNLEYQLKDIILSDNLVKSICLSSKYENVEKAVDLYMIFLLQRLGFYDNRLFAFPQLPHHIYFGNQSKLAIPDFTIMDILSYFRIAVIEDKSDSDKNQNRIEAQLIAETIAIYQ